MKFSSLLFIHPFAPFTLEWKNEYLQHNQFDSGLPISLTFKGSSINFHHKLFTYHEDDRELPVLGAEWWSDTEKELLHVTWDTWQTRAGSLSGHFITVTLYQAIQSLFFWLILTQSAYFQHFHSSLIIPERKIHSIGHFNQVFIINLRKLF